MRATMRRSLVLLVALFILVPGIDWPVGPSNPLGIGRNQQALRIARESIAIINQFFVDGNLEVLWPALDRVGYGLVPWPAGDLAQRNVIALAFRASFPNVSLRVAEIVPFDGVYAVRLSNAGSDGQFPSWLATVSPPSDPPKTPFLVDLDELGDLVSAGAPPNPGPVAAPAPSSGAHFRIAEPAQLVAARITLEPSSQHDRYLAIQGPGIVTTETGPLHVTGEGLLLAFVQGSEAWHPLQRAESLIIAPGDLLYVPNGTAIFRPVENVPIVLVYAAMIPTTRSPLPEFEGGRPIPANLRTSLSSGNTYPLSSWFGTIESVSRDREPVEGGPFTIETAWVAIPAGKTVAIDHESSPALVLEVFASNALIERAGIETRIVNESNTVATMLVLRLTPGT